MHKIEETTSTLSKDLLNVIQRTASLESAFKASSARVRELDEEVSSLKNVIHEQEQSISSLQRMNEGISKSTDAKMTEMHEVIETQKEQVQSLQSANEHFKQEVLQIIDSKIDHKIATKSETEAQEVHFQRLRDRAFQNRFNLVVSGLAEDSQKSTAVVVKDFLKSKLNITTVEILSASRLGSIQDGTSTYSRPILIKFTHLPDRNLVWRKRQTFGGNEDQQKIRIHADLPKELREAIPSLYKVAKAASKLNQYQSAKVVNYQLELDGQLIPPSKLELLPYEIRPSTLASPRSEKTLTFFSCNSVLSNHFPSDFVIDDQEYTSMEHFLAVKKARISERAPLIQKATQSRDPKQAKYILNALKDDHVELWDKEVANIAMEGLRAKFNQNPPLKSFLLETKDLELGEASTNQRWGIGMTLDDPKVMDSSHWNPEGNLLGRLLMRVREELKPLS